MSPPTSRPPSSDTLLVRAEAGHLHHCRQDHHWYHAVPAGHACPIREHGSGRAGRFTDPEDCPLCTGREEALLRGPHGHRCRTCAGTWTHEGRCADGPVAQCPWCFQWNQPVAPPGMRAGPHRHDCPRCLETWSHEEPCAAPLRVHLAACPGCRAAESGETEGSLDGDPAELASLASLAARYRPVRARRGVRLPVLVASAVVLAGMALLAPTVRRPPTPSRGSATTLPPAPMRAVPEDHSPATVTAAPATRPSVPAGLPAPEGPRGSARAFSAARPPAARPVAARPVKAEVPVQVVAIRFGVVRETPVEWLWSWRLTLQRRAETATVDARIEFIEFRGPTREVVGYQEVCGLRVAGPRVASVEGTHAISAAASRRIATVTATVSEEGGCGRGRRTGAER